MRKVVAMVVVLLLGCSVMAADVGSPATKPSAAASNSLEASAGPPSFFWIGVFMQPPGDFKKWKERGINIIATDRPKPDHKSDRTAYFAAAQAAGLKVVIYPDPENPLNDLKKPAFYAWMQADEPENWGHLLKKADGKFDCPATAESYVAIYRKLKELSPSTPVYGNFNGMQITGTGDRRGNRGEMVKDDYRIFMKGADWLSGDWYVRATGREASRIADLQGRMVDRIFEWSGGNKPVFAFIECCNQRLASAKNGAAPTASEMRAQAWIAVIHGATGIIYFPLKIGGGFQWDATPPELVQPMKELNAELKKYEQYFLKGKRVKDAKGEAAVWTMADGSSLSASATFNGTEWELKIEEKKKGIAAK
jgi:hypothetical protein